MHIFLTGQRQVGKSTLLQRALAELPPLNLGGFRTVTAADVRGALGSVYILPASDETACRDDCRVAIRYGIGRGVNAFPEVFDHWGVELLHCAEKADLIIMDEIGFLEAAAPVFSRRIAALLDGETPIFGVVRGTDETPLLHLVRTHPQVRLVEVTEANRERLRPEVTALLRQALSLPK